MRIRLHFGQHAVKEVVWWEPIEKFPHLISMDGRKWEFFMYDRSKDYHITYECHFSEVATWDNTYWSHEFTPWESLNGEFGPQCECGSVYTSFPQIHMFYCPKWKKVEIL